MEKQFAPLTAEQLASAENGTLKLEYRNGGKVMQLVWFKEPYDQEYTPVTTVDDTGRLYKHELCGCDIRMDASHDLFVCEEQPVKYGGQLTGVPVEIVEYMLDQQEAQGNKRDASVFEKFFSRGKILGGFNWYESGHFDAMDLSSQRNYEPMLEYLRKLKDDEGHK